jgi:hypothetical protein
VVTGGGWASSSDHSLHVYNSSRSGNGWQVYARNSSSSGKLLNAYAVCVSGVTATTSQAGNQVTVSADSANAYTTECDSGVVVGGGFAASADLYVYNTSRNSSGQEWFIAAENFASSGKLLNIYAICMTFQ